MSIYRKFAPRPRSDVHASTEERLVPRAEPLQVNLELEEHKHLRKEAPANIPLRRTQTWIAGLPLDVQPTALVRHFPRIANLIVATWGERKTFDAYMESLLTDKRGNRQGFPPEVLTELMALHRYRDSLEDDDLTWDAVGKRG
jgi:hypothetical protein